MPFAASCCGSVEIDLQHIRHQTSLCSLSADGVKMRLEEYISMTASAPQSENSYTGTVYTERAFLDTFVPEERLEGHQQDRNLLSVAATSQLHI